MLQEKEEFEMVASRVAEIREAADALYELSANKETRAKYEAYEKAWRDRMAEIDYAHNDGLKKGRAEGKAEGLVQLKQAQEKFVRSLLTEGMPIETIARIAELPVEKVRALAVGLAPPPEA